MVHLIFNIWQVRLWTVAVKVSCNRNALEYLHSRLVQKQIGGGGGSFSRNAG